VIIVLKLSINEVVSPLLTLTFVFLVEIFLLFSGVFEKLALNFQE
tara:strand:- start:479 stop:613 length:135 start_codon:yes stop_codon:yes gene_type:complete